MFLSNIKSLEKRFIDWQLSGVDCKKRKKSQITKIRINHLLILAFFVAPFLFESFDVSSTQKLFWGIIGIQVLNMFLYRWIPSQNISVLFLLSGIPILVLYMTDEANFKEAGLLWFILYPTICAFTSPVSIIVFSSLIAILFPHLLVYLYNRDQMFNLFVMNLNLLTIVVAVSSISFKITLRKLSLQLEKNARRYQTMARMLCHDIANPLTVMDAHSELLKVTIDPSALDSKVTNHLKKIEKSSEIMGDILRNARSLDALESGKKKINFQPFLLERVFENLEIVFEDKLKSKHLSLNTTPNISEIWLMGDETGFQNQVMANLISNAIKFSSQYKNIWINVEPFEKFVIIQVVDEGKGIPENLMDHLFDPFIETSREGTAGEIGTGFGMPIVKSWTEAMQGEISVRSQVSEGTTFEMKMIRAVNDRFINR